RVASAMATQKIYKRTYFSTPSTKTHESHAFWSGEEWNKGRAKGDQREFDISHRHLRDGANRPDGTWQQSVTIHDAVARGLGKLVDVEELRTEYSEEEFRNLFECEDVDDSESSFPWARLAPARVDSFMRWRDFKPALIDVPGGRPFGEKPVWVGYDPNKQGRDDAALAVLAVPDEPGKGKFRVLEKFRLNGLDYQGQADFIEQVAARYNVTDISIDTTGHGGAVWELVRKWFPQVRKIEYSVSSKTALVLKGQNIFRAQRIEFDAGWTDVLQAFMAIRPALTGSQKGVTYIAHRNGKIGHADIAWAILNALSNEPMDAGTAHQGGGGRVVFSD
ncbi:terminase large subunit domain-containing protein, partial [Alteraurantiacibacter buctensis]